MKALVTGGAGFIGHHLVRRLVSRGDDVVVLDDFSTGKRERLGPLMPDVRVIEGSILDAERLDDAIQGCEVVFHEAALASVARSLVDPLLSHEVNVTGSIRVMQAAARRDVRRVVFAGSSSVYGIPSRLPCDETMLPVPESPYGVTKLAAEHYVSVLGRHLGVETVTLRYFNVFGPGQDPHSDYAAVVPKFITTVLRGEQPTINGSPSISRDFTYVDNVLVANLLAADERAPTGVSFNIACGERMTLLGLLESICASAGRSVSPLIGPARAGDIEHSQADISAARTRLGYEPVVTTADGIARTVDWFARTQGDARTTNGALGGATVARESVGPP